MIPRAYDGAENYDSFNWAFDFLPGAAGGIYPASRQRMPSIFLPFSNLIEWHVMISPLAASSDNWWRTLTSEMPVPIAISVSSRSPYFFRYCRMSFMDLLPETVRGMGRSIYQQQHRRFEASERPLHVPGSSVSLLYIVLPSCFSRGESRRFNALRYVDSSCGVRAGCPFILCIWNPLRFLGYR